MTAVFWMLRPPGSSAARIAQMIDRAGMVNVLCIDGTPGVNEIARAVRARGLGFTQVCGVPADRWAREFQRAPTMLFGRSAGAIGAAVDAVRLIVGDVGLEQIGGGHAREETLKPQTQVQAGGVGEPAA